MRPPLHALMVFDTAGSHESFLEAARELNVTPGAISRQIKKLEHALGIALFTRHNRKVTLTEDGQEFWSSIHANLAKINKEAARIASRSANRQLNVRCSMLFMRYWLMPRLPDFYSQHPDFNIAFQIMRYAQMTTVEEDCSIRTGTGAFPGLTAHFLFAGGIMPVCSPAYLAKSPPLATQADLRNHTLLHSSANPESWSRWLGRDDHQIMSSAKHVHIDGDGLLYQAAIEGLGLVLGRHCLVTADLASGRLVIPLGSPSGAAEDYYLTYKERDRQPPGLKAFRLWIMNEAKAQRTKPAGPAHKAGATRGS